MARSQPIGFGGKKALDRLKNGPWLQRPQVEKLEGRPGPGDETLALLGTNPTSWGAVSPGGTGNREIISRTEIIVNVTITSGTDATADVVITAPAFTPDGTSVYAFTFYAPNVGTGTGGSVIGNLYEDGSMLSRLFGISPPLGGSMSIPIFVTRYFVPTNASHTYSWRSWRSTADGLIVAGAGTPGVYSPAYLLIEKIS